MYFYMYLYIIYTWNPNDAFFGLGVLLVLVLEGFFQSKNRGQIGSRYIYIFQYIQYCTDLREVRRATLIFIDVHEVTSRFHRKMMQMDVVDVDISRILKAKNCKKKHQIQGCLYSPPRPIPPKKKTTRTPCVGQQC